MKHFTMFVCLIAMVIALSAVAEDIPRYSLINASLTGGDAFQAKASGGDTINLMAATHDPTNDLDEPLFDGDFEEGRNGWTSNDVTGPAETHWNLSDYMSPGNQAAWAGNINIASCGPGDPAGGYANSWVDYLEFRKAVADTGVSATVRVQATLYVDSEPGYDFATFEWRDLNGDFTEVGSWDYIDTVAVDETLTYLPGQYYNNAEIAVYFIFTSDGGWSDGDCLWPTAGPAAVDNITTTISNGASDAVVYGPETFSGAEFDLNSWNPILIQGVGDFAQRWEELGDIDPCNSNASWQVAFIDDGVVVPGTGGSVCDNWCYGVPGGYIVNTEGGLAGPAQHINNQIVSPIMPWPEASFDGITFTFDSWVHEDLDANAPGVFFTWGIRSTTSTDSTQIQWAGYGGRNFVYYGGPYYIRPINDVTDIMNPGRTFVQVNMAVYELGWVWGWIGNDGYPAPYFDNVTVKVFPYVGPGMATREIDLFNDGFPAWGELNLNPGAAGLGGNSIRVDMANNIAPNDDLRNDPGDSIALDIGPVRDGAELFGLPRVYYKMAKNPVFDPYRIADPGALDAGAGLMYIEADSVKTANGSVISGRWAFDFPDTGFLWPGDELHYFIRGADAVSGVDVQFAFLPADTSGFSDEFGNPRGYNSTYVVRGLPSVFDDPLAPGTLTTPPILHWNDLANLSGAETLWYGAYDNLGLVLGEDYDIYYTNGPSSGVGNGIGGRTSEVVLQHYTDMMYTCGAIRVNTMANGDFENDPSEDALVVANWLDLGGKDLFMAGDDLASDLAQSGAITNSLLTGYVGVTVVGTDLRPLVGNQTGPRVQVQAGNLVFQTVDSWVAFGGCAGLNTFDGVTTSGSATRLAQFRDPNGGLNSYPYSAATLNFPASQPTSRVVSLPYAVNYIINDSGAKAPAPFSARTKIIDDVLTFFGFETTGPGATGTNLPGLKFAVSNYPNPFNPATTIKYTAPRAGHLSLKIYSVRGELVKTLIDGQVEQGINTIMWDGSNNQGSKASSGVYFYEARMGNDVLVNKMALVK